MSPNALTLLKLDLKSRFGFGTRIGSKRFIKWFFNALYSLLLYGIVVVGIYFVTKMFVSNGSMNYQFLVLVACISFILQLIVCTSTLVKVLYYSGDNEMLLRFPVSGEDIFFAKAAYVFINNMLLSAIIMLPFYISYGILTDAKFGFYIWMIVVTIFSGLLPFNIANIIAIPVMIAVNALRNKFALILIILIGIVVGAFAGYMLILKQILIYIQTEQIQMFSPQMVALIDGFVKYAVPYKFYANLLVGKNLFVSFAISFCITIVTAVLAAIIVKKYYFKTILSGIESQKTSFTKKTSNKQHSVFNTVLCREFKLIFRSVNYSFQYLCMAICAPVMVYFCNDIAAAVAVESIGERVLPGLTLLVVTIFITVIVSFSSTAVSREGNNFYHTKVMPVAYKQQILIKMFMYCVIATASVAVSCLVVRLCGFVDTKNALFIFAIDELTVIMLTAISMRVDTVRPVFNDLGDGELVSANKNLSLSVAVGIFLACLFGICTMLLSYIPITAVPWLHLDGTIEPVYFYLLGITAVCTTVSVASLFVGIEKRYQKIIG